ncbi:MAG: hypothetical protein JW829_01135 [Pirellulales bacterium]|nr:hypothetical protein [Pirellulales bacterium]
MDARHQTAWLRSSPSTHNTAGTRSYHRAGLVVGIALLLAGCRSGVNMDLLQQELRLYEDRIYELEYQLEDCQQEKTKLQQQLDNEKENSRKASSPKSQRGGLFQPIPSRGVPRPDIDIQEPTIEEENGIQSSEAPTPQPPAPPMENPLPPTPQEETGTHSIPSVSEELPPPIAHHPKDSSHALVGLARPLTETGPVDRIVLHRLLSTTQHPTSEQTVLEAVVEPRDANGRPVRADGEISLMILDPRRPVVEGKIARWTYELSDKNIDWRHSGLGSGMHVALPLDASLTDATYELWARLVTPDRQKHLARAEFELNRESRTPSMAQVPVMDKDWSGDPAISEPSNSGEAQLPGREVSVLVRSSNQTKTMSKSPQAPTHQSKPRRPRLFPSRKSRSETSDPLTEAPRWSPSESALDPEVSQPLRQASRPEWSPYR